MSLKTQSNQTKPNNCVQMQLLVLESSTWNYLTKYK